MSLRLLVWAVPAVLYAVFFFWYTSFGGPLTQQEVERYVSVFEERGGDAERLTRIRAFLESDTGNDFLMINNLHMKGTPDHVEGVEPGDSSDDVMAKYMRYMWPALFAPRFTSRDVWCPLFPMHLDVVGIDECRVWKPWGCNGVPLPARPDGKFRQPRFLLGPPEFQNSFSLKKQSPFSNQK